MNIITETTRLILRRFTEADENLLLELNSDPEVVKYIHEPVLETREQARNVLMNIILPQYENNLGRWAVHKKANNEFIGWCGLKYRSESGETDLGYRFKRKEWGKGYGSEAAGQCLTFGFKTLQLRHITAQAHIDNIASLRILEKIGMQFIKDGIVDECPVKIYAATNPFSIITP